MKHTYKHDSWFTLIELLVSITIFSIIMVSVITIFIFSSNLSAKVDINRSMQENIKNAVETIAEDVRKYGISGISTTPGWSCLMPTSSIYVEWNKLCTNLNEYTLKKDDGTGNMLRALNADCSDIKDHCVLYKNNSPLTNSTVSFRSLDFIVSGNDDNENKVTINFMVQPAVKRGVRSDLIKNTKLIFQTTVSERLIQSN